VISAFTACSDEPISLDIIPIEPPVSDNTPSALFSTQNPVRSASFVNPDGTEAGNTNSTTTQQIVNELRERIFAPGPTYTRDILAQVDGRMQEYSDRAEEFARACLDNATTDFVLAMPSGHETTMRLQCVDMHDGGSSSWSAFGKTGSGDIYVYEGGSTGMGIASKITQNEDVEINIYYAANTVANDVAFYQHLKSTKETGVLEFTFAGDGTGFKCGLHYKSNPAYIYVETKYNYGPLECSTADTFQVCLNASTLVTEDIAQCQADNLNSFDLESITDVVVDSFDIAAVSSMSLGTLQNFNDE